MFQWIPDIQPMLKSHETVKEAEIRAVDAARDLLRDVPGLQVAKSGHI
ncbi:MAG: hypothetical protein OXI22_02505 [Defluviicoccus sp.]|nr:hypothetical protein [Defluviicoccus sp.]